VRVDPRDRERERTMARWGLIPFWTKENPKVPHINARAETVDKQPSPSPGDYRASENMGLPLFVWAAGTSS